MSSSRRSRQWRISLPSPPPGHGELNCQGTGMYEYLPISNENSALSPSAGSWAIPHSCPGTAVSFSVVSYQYLSTDQFHQYLALFLRRQGQSRVGQDPSNRQRRVENLVSKHKVPLLGVAFHPTNTPTRWSDLRATEGWAALQHHAVLHTNITLYPPRHPDSSPPPRLLVQLIQGSYISILPASDVEPFSPAEWHAGNIYAMERTLPRAIELPTPPSATSPTTYHVFVSGDYEASAAFQYISQVSLRYRSDFSATPNSEAHLPRASTSLLTSRLPAIRSS